MSTKTHESGMNNENSLYCDACKISSSCEKTFTIHLQTKLHFIKAARKLVDERMNASAVTNASEMKSPPPPFKLDLEEVPPAKADGSVFCQVCSHTASCSKTYRIHARTALHIRRAARKKADQNSRPRPRESPSKNSRPREAHSNRSSGTLVFSMFSSSNLSMFSSTNLKCEGKQYRPDKEMPRRNGDVEDYFVELNRLETWNYIHRKF